jgi:hypothetical protein
MNATTKQAADALTTLKRDENGYGAVPAFEDFYLPEEELADGAVVDGNEIAVRRLVDDTSTKAIGIGAAYLAGHRDISAWQPAAPLGDEWNLVVVSEDDQGPYAVFARPGVHGIADGKAFAQEFLLGAMIKAATKHLRTLSKPWIDMKEGEQKSVLATVHRDCREAVRDAVDIIASNARLTFQASVDQVVFKDGVKCVLTLAKSAEAHSLADAEGSYVTIVIEERSKLLAEGNALDVDPDQKPMFDEAA